MVLDRLNTAAWAAECGSVVTHPYASRVAPFRTGISVPGSHQSPWASSPGR